MEPLNCLQLRHSGLLLGPSYHIPANALSSSVRKEALSRLAGRRAAAIIPLMMVANPSRINIQRHPARFPMPSIFIMAVARSPTKSFLLEVERWALKRLTTEGPGERCYVEEIFREK
jgi:hypothetical protein